MVSVCIKNTLITRMYPDITAHRDLDEWSITTDPTKNNCSIIDQKLVL